MCPTTDFHNNKHWACQLPYFHTGYEETITTCIRGGRFNNEFGCPAEVDAKAGTFVEGVHEWRTCSWDCPRKLSEYGPLVESFDKLDSSNQAKFMTIHNLHQ